MSLQKTKNIAVLGAGAFGTALAILYSKYFEVSLFSCFSDHVEAMRKSRENEFLSGFSIPDTIKLEVVADLNNAAFDYVFWVFPISPTISILKTLSENLDGSDIVICSKGLNSDGKFLLDCFKDILPNSKIGYLSGPNFATELAKREFSAADLAMDNLFEAKSFSQDLSNKDFSLNPTDDVIGVQICGAMKNIIAIACGIASGLSLGQNAHSAILTYGLCEMKTLGLALGAKEETFYGLCGVGDLVLTASSDISRNRTLGKRIAAGETISKICDTKHVACEGYDTLCQIMKLAQIKKVKLPICSSVFEVLFNGAKPTLVIDAIK